MRGTAYLTIVGVVSPDGTLNLRPCFQTQVPDHSEPFDSALQLEQVGDDGTILDTSPIAVTAICIDDLPTKDRAVIGKVPFDTRTRALRFVLDGREISTVRVPKERPKLRLTSWPERNAEGRHAIAWEGAHADGAALHYAVLYSYDGESWQPLSLTQSATQVDVDFGVLPGGDARVAVLATDGVNTTRVESPTFRVPVKPCLAIIFTPLDETHVDAEQRTLFAGHGCYMEERTAEFEQLTWSSSIDGELGRGALVEAVLSPGIHTITLTAGRDERAGTATTTVVVEQTTDAR